VKLIVGLGNPGIKYRGTRHNVGFEVVDEIARRHELIFESSPVDVVIARVRQTDDSWMLAKPETFMNLSGQAVGALVNYYRIEIDEVLVVIDDVNLPLGRLRVRRVGSDGGHNGLRSVLDVLGREEVARLRVGVDRGDKRRELSAHVLAKFEKDESEIINSAIFSAANAAELFVREGLDAVMRRYNNVEIKKE
tara:strand:- start:647 stop:1225 length:579 start_codon:yes stop_codon:yes gene_type:complete